jgi:putative endonuclease
MKQRLASHNAFATKGWTIRYRPWEVIHTQSFSTKLEAMEKEKYFKSGKGREEITKFILPEYLKKI